MAAEPLIIRPQDLSLKVNELSERIILGIMQFPELEIIGLSSAIFLTCSAVNMAADIANVNINEICLDYVKVPILGEFEAVLIRVGTESTIDRKKKREEEEKGMVISTQRNGQVIAVRRGDRIERLVTLSLIKFKRFDKLKLMAAASAINDAISFALKLTKGKVAKEPIGISFIDLETFQSKDDPTKRNTGLYIYLKKGTETEISQWHKDFLKRLKKRRTV